MDHSTPQHNSIAVHPVRQIDVFIYDGMNLLDVAGPVQAFTTAKLHGKNAYQHHYLSRDGVSVTTCCGMKIHADGKLDAGRTNHDLLIPGGIGVDAFLTDEGLKAIIANWLSSNGNNRIISICSGAFLIANSGLLDGKEATTHWSRKAQTTQQFPQVDWNLDKIYVYPDSKDQRVYTSAGVTTGIDLALSIIAEDLGAKAALDVAQELVVYLKRSGGQSQFSNYLMQQYKAKSSDQSQITKLIEDINHAPVQNWTLEAMAEKSGINTRTLSRKFQSQFDLTPTEFVEQVRLDKARNLLTTNAVLKQVANTSGFGDVQRMRRAFKRRLGVTLKDYVDGFG